MKNFQDKIEQLAALCYASNKSFGPYYYIQIDEDGDHIFLTDSPSHKSNPQKIELMDALSTLVTPAYFEKTLQYFKSYPCLKFSSATSALFYKLFMDFECNIHHDEKNKRTSAQSIQPLGLFQHEELTDIFFSNSFSEYHTPLKKKHQAFHVLKELISGPYDPSLEEQALQAIKTLYLYNDAQSFDNLTHHNFISYAVKNKQTEWVPFLINHIDSTGDWKGYSGFHESVRHNDKKTLYLLLNKNSHSNKPLSRSVRSSYNVSLFVATQLNHSEIVQLLLKFGADANSFDLNGERILELSAKKGQTKIVELLVVNGAMLDAENSQGLIPAELVPQDNDGLFNWMEQARLYEQTPSKKKEQKSKMSL